MDGHCGQFVGNPLDALHATHVPVVVEHAGVVPEHVCESTYAAPESLHTSLCVQLAQVVCPGWQVVHAPATQPPVHAEPVLTHSPLSQTSGCSPEHRIAPVPQPASAVPPEEDAPDEELLLLVEEAPLDDEPLPLEDEPMPLEDPLVDEEEEELEANPLEDVLDDAEPDDDVEESPDEELPGTHESPPASSLGAVPPDEPSVAAAESCALQGAPSGEPSAGSLAVNDDPPQAARVVTTRKSPTRIREAPPMAHTVAHGWLHANVLLSLARYRAPMPRKPGSAALARKLGARLRTLRQEAGIKQETWAWDSGLDKGFLSQVESGKRMPSVPVLFALAKRLGVEVADLVAINRTNPRLRLLDAARRLSPKKQEELAAEIERRLRG